MLEFARYEGRKRVRGALVLSAGMSLLAAFAIWAFPSFRDSLDPEALLDAYPAPMVEAFRIEDLGSVEGFLATELYVFGWVILLGLYFAYSAASVVAGDVDRGRMDTLLAMPVSRRRLVAEKFLALGVPIVAVNVVTPVVVLVGTRLIDEATSVQDVLVLHLLSIPYLFACAGIGLLASVVFDRETVAQRVALGITFALFLVESLVGGTDYEAVGAVAPMRYYDPNGVIIDGSYDLVGAGVLVGMALVALVASQLWFGRTDV